MATQLRPYRDMSDLGRTKLDYRHFFHAPVSPDKTPPTSPHTSSREVVRLSVIHALLPDSSGPVVHGKWDHIKYSLACDPSRTLAKYPTMLTTEIDPTHMVVTCAACLAALKAKGLDKSTTDADDYPEGFVKDDIPLVPDPSSVPQDKADFNPTDG